RGRGGVSRDRAEPPDAERAEDPEARTTCQRTEKDRQVRRSNGSGRNGRPCTRGVGLLLALRRNGEGLARGSRDDAILVLYDVAVGQTRDSWVTGEGGCAVHPRERPDGRGPPGHARRRRNADEPVELRQGYARLGRDHAELRRPGVGPVDGEDVHADRRLAP